MYVWYWVGGGTAGLRRSWGWGGKGKGKGKGRGVNRLGVGRGWGRGRLEVRRELSNRHATEGCFV